MFINQSKWVIVNIKNPQTSLNDICGLSFFVSEMRFELTQPYGHYPLKVACLPIPPPGQSENVCHATSIFFLFFIQFRSQTYVLLSIRKRL